MPGVAFRSYCIYARCPHRQLQHLISQNGTRAFSVSPALAQSPSDQEIRHDETRHGETRLQPEEEEDKGAMSRRLEDMIDRTIEEGGQAAQKVVEEAGFSEELKRTLEFRIADSKFRSENPAAFAQLNMPVC